MGQQYVKLSLVRMTTSWNYGKSLAICHLQYQAETGSAAHRKKMVIIKDRIWNYS